MRPSGPDLTIVIPTLNSATWIQSVIENWVALRPEAEIVVVNDASTDSTAEVLDQLAVPQLRVISNAERLGQARSTVLGCHAARTAWILTIDDDLVVDAAESMLIAEDIRRGGVTYLDQPPAGIVRHVASLTARRIARLAGVQRGVSQASSIRVFPAAVLRTGDHRPIDHALATLTTVRRSVVFDTAGSGASRYRLKDVVGLWRSYVNASRADT